jgi:hypothetical protein
MKPHIKPQAATALCSLIISSDLPLTDLCVEVGSSVWLPRLYLPAGVVVWHGVGWRGRVWYRLVCILARPAARALCLALWLMTMYNISYYGLRAPEILRDARESYKTT